MSTADSHVHQASTPGAARLEQIPGTALAAWCRRLLDAPMPDRPAEAASSLPPLEEWSRRWHGWHDVADADDISTWGPGGALELELLDGVIAELRKVVGRA